MNKWMGIGRLTRDPELIYTPSGVAITTFTLAVDRRFKNAQGERDTDFITIKTFKQLAELCAQYLGKSKLAGVSGELQIRTYNDKEGQKHWVTEIAADEVQFLSPKAEGSQQSQQQTQPQAQPQTQQGYPTPGYTPQQQGYPGQYGSHPNMSNPNMPPPSSYQGQPPGQLQFGQAQGQPQGQPQGQGPARQYGHEVNLGDDIPF